MRNRLEGLVKGGDRVTTLLDCDRKNELYLTFTNRVYGFNGPTLDAQKKEMLVEYSLINGHSGPKQKVRKPTSYEVALLNNLSKTWENICSS